LAYTLHYYELWPDAMAIRVAMTEQGAQTALARVDMSKDEHHLPAFLALNPQGEPPVLVDSNGPLDDPNHGPVALWETLAIAQYVQDKAVLLANANPVLYPRDPCGYPLAKQWASWAQISLVPPFEQILLHSTILPTAQRNALTLASGVSKARKALKLLEGQVPDVSAGEKFMAREAHSNPSGWFSFADISIGATLTYTKLVKAQISLQAFPRTAAYLGTLEQRSSFASIFSGVTLP
jgi:glutathione S-transferase